MPCTQAEFQCSPGECIAKAWVCDHQNDCENGEDEKNCHSKLLLMINFIKKGKINAEYLKAKAYI